jgi:NADPH:quinone reductase-like Zn-dependent oxidoreductase
VLIADVYVRAEGQQLRGLAGLLALRKVDVCVAAVYPLTRAADALALVAHGGADGAVVLRP